MLNEVLMKAKRKARYCRRSAGSSQLYPLRLQRSELSAREAYYQSLTDDMVKEMEGGHWRLEDGREERILFTDYEILSFNGDRMGKVFGRDGEIYRGIYKGSCDTFQELWGTGLLQVLASRGLIPDTEITKYCTPEYPIILKHAQVQIVASKLWNTQMIKDAAALIAFIKGLAQRVGFTLHDGHLNNVTFHEGRPVFTDIGSFVKNKGQYTVCNKEILFSGCYRILFRQLGNSILSRIQPYDEQNNAIWLQPRFYDDLTREYNEALKRYMSYHRWHSSAVSRHLLRRMFYCYEVKPAYIDLLFASKTQGQPEEQLSGDMKIDIDYVVETLQKLKLDMRSAVDAGGTMGVLGWRLSAGLGIPTVSLESSDEASAAAYSLYKDKKVEGNTLEFHYLYGCDNESRKAVQADVAIALDITRNVVSYQQYRVDSLFNSLKKLTRRYAVVTFYPEREQPERYIPMSAKESIEEIKMCFQQFFNLIEIRKIPKSGKKEDEGYVLIGEVSR